MFQLKIKSCFVKLRNLTCGTTRFRIEGFHVNLNCILILNSHCVTPAAVIVKKFFMILQMTIFLFFFSTLSTRKIGNRLSLQKIKFTFPLTFVLIVSAGRPLFDSQQLAFLLVEWVGKNTHFSLPHPFALFLLASLGGSPPQSERLEEAIRHTSIAF